MSLYPAPLDSLDAYTSLDTADLAMASGTYDGAATGGPSYWANLIRQLAPSFGVDPNQAVRLATFESGLNPNAVSSAGAVGLFQVLPSTGASLGYDVSDPLQNIQAGLTYWAQKLAAFGGDAQAAYAQGYNPGYSGPGPFASGTDAGTIGRQTQAACIAGCKPMAFGICLNPSYIMGCNQAGQAATTQAQQAGASACEAQFLGAHFTDPVCALKSWVQESGVRLLILVIAAVVGFIALNALLNGAPVAIVTRVGTGAGAFAGGVRKGLKGETAEAEA